MDAITPETDTTNARRVDPPSSEFAAMVAAKVECHLRAGHFAIAVRVIAQAERDWAEELRERARQLVRSAEEWLDRPLPEFGLLVRTVTALEEVGCHTMREALTYLNSGKPITNFGPKSADEVWAAAKQRRITIERRYVPLKPGGWRDRTHTPEQKAKFNPHFETGFQADRET